MKRKSIVTKTEEVEVVEPITPSRQSARLRNKKLGVSFKQCAVNGFL